ncbi:MAG: DUF2062 domain-containing protein [Proteobacteria bacterium]|nr:DUF2062 domain-containing protein [Pseudomonadota bacterium]
MPRKYFRKYLPDHESIRENRYVRWFGPLLHHPNLWHLNRRSVSGGVAIGLFAGLIPGPLQMITAALLAVPLRVNLPVALITTLYTNPFSIGPLYLLAYEYGRLLIGEGVMAPDLPPDIDWAHLWSWLQAFGGWMLALGKPLAVGLAALALTLALAGYVLVQAGWRIQVRLAWRERARRRAAKTGGGS